MTKKQRIRDPVHNLIEFTENGFDQMCWKVIQTPQFQRLRRIKQLGFSEFVYPGATHSRLAHSLGVFHTARRLADVIKGIRPDAFDTRRAQEAMAAALVHDIGHGPFSHAFEDVLKRLGLGKHETKSVRLIRETEVTEALNEISPDFSQNVSGIIGAEAPANIYAAIVSSQFDADRLDYMRRDRLMTGTQSSAIDFEWLLANLEIERVPIGQDDRHTGEIETLVVGKKAILAAEAYVLGLFQLYPTVYLHKTTRGAEKLFSALLYRVFELAIDGSIEKLGLPTKHPLVTFAKSPDDLEAFVKLDDAVIWGAMPMLTESTDPCVSEFADRLLRRRLFKAIDVTANLRAKAQFGEDRDKAARAEAKIRDRLRNDNLLKSSSDSPPLALDDVAQRNPYKRHKGDEGVLERIHAINRADELGDLADLSKVVEALEPFSAYRIYYRRDDDNTAEKLKKIMEDVGP